MKNTILIAAFFLSPMGASLAVAGDDCNLPMANWQPREAVQKMAEARGWTVRRIKTDDGCYEVKGRDENGREIEVKVDPGSLAIVDMQRDDDDGEDRGGPGQNAAPAGTVTPPDNGLFNSNSAPKVEVK